MLCAGNVSNKVNLFCKFVVDMDMFLYYYMTCCIFPGECDGHKEDEESGHLYPG